MAGNLTSLRKVLTNSPIYALGDLLQSGAGFLLLPVYTRHLPTHEYGYAIISILVARLASGIISLHIQSAVVRFTYDAPEDHSYLSRLYGTVFAFAAVLSLTALIIGVILVGPMLSLFGISDIWNYYAYLTVVLAVTTSSYDILQRIMQAHQLSHRYVVQQWFYFLLGTIVTLTLMVGFNIDGLSIVIGQTVNSSFFFIYSLIYIARNYGFTMDRILLKSCLSYSLYLLPNRYAGLLPRVVDRFFVTSLSVGAAGVYSIGFRIGEGLSFLSGGFFRAHMPWFYATVGDGNESSLREIVAVGRTAILVISLLGVMVSLFAEEVIILALGPDYHSAWEIVPISTFVVVFNSIKELWLRPITYDKKATKYVPIATYTFAIISIGLMAWMVPYFGIIGAAGAILAARFFSSFVMLFISLRVRNVGYPIIEVYLVALMAFGCSCLAYLPITNLLLIKLGITFLCITVVVAIKRYELAQIIKSLREIIAPATS